MRILVVGGAGYIGSHVVKALLKKEHQVCVYDNLSTGLMQNLQKGAEFVQGDIQDPELLLKTLQSRQIEGVIHLAALKAAGESMELPGKYSFANLNGSIHLINACVEAGVENFLFSSSAAVYGEPQYLPIDEKHPTVQENYYGFTKRKVEEILEWYDQLTPMRYASLRYFNAAGYDVEGDLAGLERNPANLLPIVMEVAVGQREKMLVFGDDYPTPDGSCIRDYIHVSDLADAHVRALEKISETKESLMVNLGSEVGVSVLEMIESARRITGQEIAYEIVGRRAGDPAKLVASAAEAKEKLGWEAQHSDVDTLIASSYQAYQKNYGK